MASSASNSMFRHTDDADCLQGGLGDGELGEKVGIHPRRGLVGREHVVAKGLDHSVEAGAQMCDPRLTEQGEC